MTLHVIGYSAGTDPSGTPTAVPTQVMAKDIPTAEDAMSYIRSYNRTLPPGKTFLFSMSGTPDAPAATDGGDATAEQGPSDDGLNAAMCCFDYALNSVGSQLTGLLSEEGLTYWIDDKVYDGLVEAQNIIVQTLEWLEADGPSEDGVQEASQ